MANSAKTKQEINATVAPVGLIPLATGTAFLILGARGENSCPGHPSLPVFLLLAGSLTIGLGVMTTLCKVIVEFGLPSENRPLIRQEENVVWFLRRISHVMTASQIVILVVGTVIVAPLAAQVHPWDYVDPNADYYCDYGTVIFSAIFFPAMYFLLLLTAAAYLVVKCYIEEGPPTDESGVEP